MNGKKKLLMALLVLVLFGTVAAGVCWNLQNYVFVDLRFYPKGAQQLDLRGQNITVKHYEKLHAHFPDCKITWDVPFGETKLPSDTKEITLTQLSDQDLRALNCLGMLERVDAKSCSDYEQLMQLQKNRPELKVEYTVALGKEQFAGTAKKIALEDVSEEEVALLGYFPNLKSVLCGGGDAAAISALMEYCREHGQEFNLTLGGEVIPLDTREVIAGSITDAQLGLLQFLPEMEKLHIRQPEASAENLVALKNARPDVNITWERELFGTVFSSDLEEIDLSGVKITSLEDLNREMAYYPEVKTVFLGEAGLDNEELAAQRDLVRDQYKLVWTVSCGSKLKTRTDATTFMPVREHVYYFNDEEAYNLRYCEDMVCIDIGHMSIHNIDFVEYMPKLEYLILAHTQLQYIEPIRHCKNLKFLELDWSPVKDLTPLKECTALEDLNLGNTFADFAPVGEMTWLKNLWMVGCSTGARYRMPQALPDTKVMVTGSATVANGWRDLENYYEMRDLLGMHYMSW